MFKTSQLQWSGHMCHMSDEHLSKRLFYGELKVGKVSHAGQKKCYKDTLKASLRCYGIIPDSLEEAAQVCATGYRLPNTGVIAYEEHRADEAIQKCQQLKSRPSNNSMPNPLQAIQCLQCNRVLSGMDWTNEPSPYP